jgi:hypothetical protein
MSFIKRYFHEIYSVITLLLITASAIFVVPDSIQKLALAFMLLFLLHEWEENNYPGGFFKNLFGDILTIDPVPHGEKLLAARVFVYLMLFLFTLPPYFAHTHAWLILPVTYLGILEGIAHNVAPRVFRLEKKYLPGVVTAVCQFILSAFTLWFLISNHLARPWQYIAGFLIFILGFFMMGRCGMGVNGIDFREVPGKAARNFKKRRGIPG